MPTRLRVDLAGCHHVINRGVNGQSLPSSYRDTKRESFNIYAYSQCKLCKILQ